AFLVGFLFVSPALAGKMPPVKAADLNEKEVSWPQGLPAKRTILLFAFERNQQDNIDGWVSGMKLKGSGAPAWYEVPLINNPGALGRWFIDNGMRSGIKETTDRARVVTVYTKKSAFMKSLGIPNESDVHALVVDRNGDVIVRVSGDYSIAGAAKIRSALKP
ncbi:MAG: hypothetical protein ACRCT6_00530, partial [Notoacmeibacter sp.]